MRSEANILFLLLQVFYCVSQEPPVNIRELLSLGPNVRLEDAIQDLSPEQRQKFIEKSQEALQEAMTDFTQAIYLHMLTVEEGNFAFSPLSLHSALSMLYLGTTTGSETEIELGKALGSVQGKVMIKGGYKEIIDTYHNQPNFLFGNNFWIQDGVEVKDTFRNTIRDNLNSGIDSIDFDATNSTDIVNQWVSGMTGGKIKKMVEKFSPDTALFLANALYFKEDWLVPFEDVDYTQTPLFGDFETKNGKIKVPMIQQINPNATYGEIEVFGHHLVEVVSLPYKNDQFEMQIIAPESIQQLHQLEAKMNQSVVQDNNPRSNNFFNVFSYPKDISDYGEYIEDIYLRMPTFQVRSDLDVAQPLMELGARKVFTAGAELGEVVEQSGPFSVGKISHTAVVEVTKEGTEGASATGVEIVLLSAPFPYQQKDVTVDGPFIFVVHDKINKIPVLVGRILDPTQKIP